MPAASRLSASLTAGGPGGPGGPGAPGASGLYGGLPVRDFETDWPGAKRQRCKVSMRFPDWQVPQSKLSDDESAQLAAAVAAESTVDIPELTVRSAGGKFDLLTAASADGSEEIILGFRAYLPPVETVECVGVDEGPHSGRPDPLEYQTESLETPMPLGKHLAAVTKKVVAMRRDEGGESTGRGLNGISGNLTDDFGLFYMSLAICGGATDPSFDNNLAGREVITHQHHVSRAPSIGVQAQALTELGIFHSKLCLEAFEAAATMEEFASESWAELWKDARKVQAPPPTSTRGAAALEVVHQLHEDAIESAFKHPVHVGNGPIPSGDFKAKVAGRGCAPKYTFAYIENKMDEEGHPVKGAVRFHVDRGNSREYPWTTLASTGDFEEIDFVVAVKFSNDDTWKLYRVKLVPGSVVLIHGLHIVPHATMGLIGKNRGTLIVL